MKIDERRLLQLNNYEFEPTGPIIYWMSRDQRVHGNWALLYAQQLSEENNLPLAVVFCLSPNFLDATFRQYDFMIKGLEEVEQELKEYNISFHLLLGDPTEQIEKFCKKHEISTLITDFSPLRIGRKWREKISKELTIPMIEVDAHNIVPCFFASNKQEFGAYTLRPKLNKVLDDFLTEYPSVKKASYTLKNENKIEWDKLLNKITVNMEVKPIDWVKPGYRNAIKTLNKFIENIDFYEKDRNNPTANASSNLSPYLHFGHISSQEVVLKVMKNVSKDKTKSFLEEIIIRKELADNFCYFNTNYDNTEGFHDWAKKSLNEHRNDKRDYIYSKHDFEYAKTHDPLWNAAQLEMINKGKMHGYMRMYWAKKILEWTSSPEDAMKIAIYLNDKYELDGRDPNGYTGISWSIGGTHDRAWFERKVYGKIRYMNDKGCESKFNVKQYIQNQK
ncbi:MAG: deoxyribodipyrimidine photo-lyase [Proteobacteria bacterium]|nr:deoxyribodipyrimidine photo-lyase [Pseudomonadota bacterium]